MNLQYLIMGTIFSWGVGSIFYKMANDHVHPIIVATCVAAVSIVLIPLAFIFVKFPKEINTAGITYAVVGALCMDIGTLAFFFALKKGAAGNITAVTSLYPAVTLVLSLIFFHEGINIKKTIGLTCSLVGIYFLGLK
jgi:bacterial/archaeal transporter family protein